MDYQYKLSLAIFFFLIAYYYSTIKLFFDKNEDIAIEQEIIKSWNTIIRIPIRKKTLRLSIGLNTNVDLITAAIPLLSKLGSAKVDSVNHPVINSLEEFKQTFTYFFQKGSAAERSISNLEDFNRITEATNDLNNHYFIGGNAALMAESIVNRFNAEVMLIGPVGRKLKGLLNEKIKIPNEVLIDKDEVHLILEYNLNQQWNGIKPPQSNRFIVSHDVYNSKIEMLDLFFNLSKLYDPDALILAGFHLVESQNEEFRLEKLQNLKRNLENYDAKTSLIHFELASIGDKSLMKSIIDNGIFNHVNSIGLNEQELLFLSHSSNGPHENYYKDISGSPDVYKIIDILEWILSSFGKSESKLTRIHFHYLMYHIIALNDDRIWSNTESSLLAGSKIASKQACDLDYHEIESEDFHKKLSFQMKTKMFEVEKDKFIMLNSTNPIIKFARNSIKFYITPVLVCKMPLKTVGLGDAISSTGLFYSLFNYDT